MNIPGNLLYTNDHEWIKIDGGEGIVGVTDFAQHELGDIVFIEVDTV
ncbi:MAG TPA: glycine cleavage system protein H, partial [Bacteroidales bacterium]|nr:glycine cleavage system protein H [Bacteroidales bacterium]